MAPVVKNGVRGKKLRHYWGGQAEGGCGVFEMVTMYVWANA